MPRKSIFFEVLVFQYDFCFFSVIVNHATTQGPFHTSTCPQCPTKFTNYKEYKKHLEDIHCDQKICGSCGKFFPTEEVLKNHMISAHKGVKFTRKGTEKKGKYNPHKKVVCDLCGKPFAGSLYTHKMKVCGIFLGFSRPWTSLQGRHQDFNLTEAKIQNFEWL